MSQIDLADEWKKNLPENIAKKIEEYFSTNVNAKCSVCQETIIAARLPKHLINCANVLNMFYGNSPFDINSVNEFGEKKRKLDEVKDEPKKEQKQKDEIQFPLPTGYYNNTVKQATCDFRACSAKNSGHHVDRSVYVYCGGSCLHFCK